MCYLRFIINNKLLQPSLNSDERYKLLRHNVYVHPTCVLGHNSVVSNNSIVGVGTVVGKNCRISNSVIGNNCSIEENCELTGADKYVLVYRLIFEISL